jgi:hypothetical protein
MTTTAPTAVTFTDPDGAQSAPFGDDVPAQSAAAVPPSAPQPSTPLTPPAAAVPTSSPAAAPPAVAPQTGVQAPVAASSAPAAAKAATPPPVPFSTPKIPDFEGLQVEATKAAINAAQVEVNGAAFKTDQVVTVVTEVRVTGVHHKVNNDGKLERHHNFKVIDTLVINSPDTNIDTFREAFGA